MPKKTKKGKAGKGKKESKSKNSESKKDAILKDATANALFWESRLESTERVKKEYRDNARKLCLENESLQNKLKHAEKDTLQVITFLKAEDVKKEDQISKSEQQLKDYKKNSSLEKDQLIEKYTKQIHDLKEALDEKTNEVRLMQSELRLVKEFRKKRALMQRELEEIKDSMFATEKKHKTILSKMEQKFFEEKIRLQQEANRKISELAERAHSEAVNNLDETTRSVYKENIRINAALEYHMTESKDLRKSKATLEGQKRELENDKELNGLIVQEKVVESKHQKKTIKELKEKVEMLEKSLSHVIREFDVERTTIVKRSTDDNKHAVNEIARLNKMIELKTKEMNRVKRLAKNILDQRNEIEHFLLDSLEHVKNEIAKNRSQYRKDAHAAYQERMLEAHSGRGNYPKIRTFNKWDTSTNSVFDDLKEAEIWTGFEERVDINDLTWEQRERVLRLLFAKLNGHKSKQRRPVRALEDSNESKLCIPEETRMKSEDLLPEQSSATNATFITQQPFPSLDSRELPAIAR
ncbi:basal body-orientation factor 1-like [Xenia sp. Carnegie-2017]|uniref:basal body-orientation factor 1-like n=1 Tax=Xenia sp. Carnegie-2017 TaxID=2897299 RepID=UPI001F044EF4|nr:basal body-orientation factor 1-like [Xenia sp. Carnegie-2017]